MRVVHGLIGRCRCLCISFLCFIPESGSLVPTTTATNLSAVLQAIFFAFSILSIRGRRSRVEGFLGVLIRCSPGLHPKSVLRDDLYLKGTIIY